jgi:hypothetical protein
MSSTNESAAWFNDPEFQQYITDLKAFISLFPPGKMNDELWQLVCTLYDKHDEVNWQYSDRFNIYAMYKLLGNLCNSLQAIVAYFEPPMKPDVPADER